MVPSAHRATLPEGDIARQDDCAIAQSYMPSARYVEHHPRESLYRQFAPAYLHGKYDTPEGYPFVFPSPHPTESQFGSPVEHKTIHCAPNSYLSQPFETPYAPCESPHSQATSVQEPRVCNAGPSPEFAAYRMSRVTLNDENQTNRPEFNSDLVPPHSSTHPLPLLVHPSESYMAYSTEPQPSDYYHPINPISFQYYANSGRGLTPSELDTAPLNGDRHPYAPSLPIQNSERPFKCTSCSSGFNRNHDLKRHTRIHLLVKPFPCGWCEKTFSRKDALKRHLLVKGCAGTDKVTVDESIRRAEEKKLTQNHNADTPDFNLPFSEDSSQSPIDDANCFSGSSGSEETQLTMSNSECNSRYSRSARLPKHSRASHDGGLPSDRFSPYVRPAPYHHRSQPNILAYGRESWQSPELKTSEFHSSSQATAVLPPPRPSELSSTSSISSLLDGPDYGAEFRAAYSYDHPASAPLASHASSPAGCYTQRASFPTEEYNCSMYHSTPRSSTSDSIGSSSTLTSSHLTLKSESPAAIPHQTSSPTPSLNPSGIALSTDAQPLGNTNSNFNGAGEYPLEIKCQRSSRSPTPQEVQCISSIRCRAK